jgi:peptidoglycan-N-acetylmuramic acid deacetylase
MRRATERRPTAWRRATAVLVLTGLALGVPWVNAAPVCEQPVYLTFDTGHMGVAPLIADVLKRHNVKATFFLASERTKTGGTSLDDAWAPWWKARAQEGHAFGSHTWDHDILRSTKGGAHSGTKGNTNGGAHQSTQSDTFTFVPTSGLAANRARTMDAAAYCRELSKPAERFTAMTGQPMGAIFRAAGGKTSPALLKAAQACGWSHVAWAEAGFLGDELSSDKFPNQALLQKALTNVRSGDILLAHLGIWSRQDPWAPAVLEPLVTGLKAKGFCFATLRDHPSLGDASRRTAPALATPSAKPAPPASAKAHKP